MKKAPKDRPVSEIILIILKLECDSLRNIIEIVESHFMNINSLDIYE